MKYIITTVLLIFLLASCSCDNNDGIQNMLKIRNTIGLYQCIQNTYYQKDKYLNFDQYLFVNKDKLHDLSNKINTLKGINTKVLQSNSDGMVEMLLSYSIDNKEYKCVFSLDFSKKERNPNVLRYE